MKCEKCGGNLTLEDVVCPYCDALNEHAVQHIRDMNRYKREFEGTKKEVYSVTKGYAGITVRAVIITVLIVLIVVCAVISGESYSIRRNILEGKAARNVEEYKQTMDRYLEERDYYAFAAFCEEKYIRTFDENYSDYNCLIYAANRYAYLYDYIMQSLNPYSDSLEDNIQWISEQLDSFYIVFEEEEASYYSVVDSKKNREIVLEMQEQIHALLMAYCGLNEEDVKELPNMTSAKRAVLLEERMINAE